MALFMEEWNDSITYDRITNKNWLKQTSRFTRKCLSNYVIFYYIIS